MPRFSFPAAAIADPLSAFAPPADGSTARPLWLEIGFGSGEHCAALCEVHPDCALIAAEVFENGVASLMSRLVPEGQEATAMPPPGLRLWPADARAVIAGLPDGALDRLFLMFPDPWPKARHTKRRFVHPASLAAVARAMAPGAVWRIASDDPTYQAWVETTFAGQNFFARGLHAAARPPDWPATRYEAKALRAGRVPQFWQFVRTHHPAL